MIFNLPGISGRYIIADPKAIETPRLVVFRDRVEENIRRMRNYLAELTGKQDLGILCPHVKTHKSAWVTRLLMENGVTCFKASPNEIDMLAQTGAERVFVAYPPLPHLIQRLDRLAERYPLTRWAIQISQLEHIAWIGENSRRTWDFYIDIDIGMHRTGIEPQLALELGRAAQAQGFLHFVGLHAYDGHNHYPDPEQRRSESAHCMQTLVQILHKFDHAGLNAAEIMVGGTPSALVDLENLLDFVPNRQIRLSPGTWVYHDSTYEALMPGKFQLAALILAQVMDRIDDQHVTLNVGHKRWAVDQGPPDRISLAEAKFVRWSEEHTVVQLNGSSKVGIGEYVLFAPRHVCSTVNLWEYFCRIGHLGEIEDPRCPIQARNR
ncbi:alanine racemase [candidate division KSB1 bacterium]|nr:alanine racemase [candidate division KSB1 bacterium]